MSCLPWFAVSSAIVLKFIWSYYFFLQKIKTLPADDQGNSIKAGEILVVSEKCPGRRIKLRSSLCSTIALQGLIQLLRRNEEWIGSMALRAL